MGCLALLQGIFPTQGLNPGLPRCRLILYHLKLKNIGVGSLSLLLEIFLTQKSNQGLLHCRWILYQLSYQGSLLGLYIHLKILHFLILIFLLF